MKCVTTALKKKSTNQRLQDGAVRSANLLFCSSHYYMARCLIWHRQENINEDTMNKSNLYCTVYVLYVP